MSRAEVASAWGEDYRRRVPARTQEMVRAYVEEGLSYAAIGRRFGLSRQRVGQLLGPLGVAQERTRSKIEREQILREAHERIMARKSTLAEEAEILGFTPDSLRGRFRYIGLNLNLGYADPPHGTFARYRSRRFRCRCKECRRANNERIQELKGLEPPNHGTYSGYVNYACRCQACKEAHRRVLRERRATKRQKEVTI